MLSAAQKQGIDTRIPKADKDTNLILRMETFFFFLTEDIERKKIVNKIDLPALQTESKQFYW